MKNTFHKLVIFSLWICSCGHGAWFFLPNYHHNIRGIEKTAIQDYQKPDFMSSNVYREMSQDKSLSKEQINNIYWHPASFPHREFVSMMPGKSVFGWYSCVFNIPKYLENMDVLLDLGIIDDSDETFINGKLIGSHGKVPDGSAWQADRHYRVGSDNLRKDSSNYVAIHSWSLWGLGGMSSPPCLKAAIAPLDAQWEVTFVNDKALTISGLNYATDLKQALKLCFKEKAPDWRKSSILWKDYARWKNDERYAVFRLSFQMTDKNNVVRRFSEPVLLDIGSVFDVASIYLNGKRIGRVGRFAEGRFSAFTEASQRGQFIVSPQAWSPDGSNELAVVIYRERGIGGLPESPGILLDSSPEASGAPFPVSESFTRFIQSEQMEAAAGCLKTTKAKSKSEEAWLLSHEAHLAYLKWFDGGAKDRGQVDLILSCISRLLKECSPEAPRQSAMQAFCTILRLAEKDSDLLEVVRRHFPEFNEKALAKPLDWKTKGDWIPYRGHDAYVLASMAQTGDWVGGFRPLKISKGIPGDRGKPRHWLAPENRYLSDPSALLIPSMYRAAMYNPQNYLKNVPDDGSAYLSGQKVRRAAWWDDNGEMHPFDDEGPDLNLNISGAPKELHFLTLYMMDADWRNTVHPRQQSVLVLDNENRLLNAVWLGKIDTGVHASFAMVGDNAPLSMRIMKHRSACVAVNALFMDVPQPKLRILPYSLRQQDERPISSNDDPYKALQLGGKLQLDTIIWYNDLRNSTGKKRLMLAREYLIRQRELLSPEAWPIGSLVYAIAAETCGDSANALKAWTDALPTEYDAMGRVTVLLNTMSEDRLVRHGCWYLSAVKKALEHLPTDEAFSKEEACRFLCSLGNGCLFIGALPGMIACREELKKRRIPDTMEGIKKLDNFIRKSIGKPGGQRRLVNAVPPK